MTSGQEQGPRPAKKPTVPLRTATSSLVKISVVVVVEHRFVCWVRIQARLKQPLRFIHCSSNGSHLWLHGLAQILCLLRQVVVWDSFHQCTQLVGLAADTLVELGPA